MYVNEPRGYVTSVGDAVPAPAPMPPAQTGGTLSNIFSGITQGLAAAFGAGSQPQVVVPAQSSGPDLTTIAVIGAIGIGAILILRKKK